MRAQKVLLIILLTVILGGLLLGCIAHGDCLVRC